MEKFFLPYEESLLLKELGFDVPCIGKYWTDEDDNLRWISVPEIAFDIPGQKLYHGYTMINYNTKFYESEGTISAPLYDQVIDWFFTQHGLHIYWEYSTTTKKDWVITINKTALNDARDEEYQTPQAARLAGIRTAIKMIQNK